MKYVENCSQTQNLAIPKVLWNFTRDANTSSFRRQIFSHIPYKKHMNKENQLQKRLINLFPLAIFADVRDVWWHLMHPSKLGKVAGMSLTEISFLPLFYFSPVPWPNFCPVHRTLIFVYHHVILVSLVNKSLCLFINVLICIISSSQLG